MQIRVAAREMTAEDTASVADLAKLSGANLDLGAEREKPFTRVWVAGDPVCAYLLAWCIADELQIVDLATAPLARRKGAARALLDSAALWARGCGCSKMLLEVREDNTAAGALYTSAGFAIVRTRTSYYADGMRALEMEKTL